MLKKTKKIGISVLGLSLSFMMFASGIPNLNSPVPATKGDNIDKNYESLHKKIEENLF